MTEGTNHSSDALKYGDTTLFCAKFLVSGYSLITPLLFFKCSDCLIVMITNASRNFFFDQYHLNGFQSIKPFEEKPLQ